MSTSEEHCEWLSRMSRPRPERRGWPLDRTYPARLEGRRGVEIYAHHPLTCRGEVCTLHNRTDHAMRSWPQWYRFDRGIMERVCPKHGCGHPDPDDRRIRSGEDAGDHGCCGCCG